MPESSAPRFAVTAGREIADVAPALRDYLRSALASPSLDFSSPPSAILGGFDTSIYAFRVASAPEPYDGALILRLFRTPDDAERAAYEATIQNAIVSLGYPAPKVAAVEPSGEFLGAPFMIMARLRGRVMLDALLSPRMFSMPPLLARAHARLHTLAVEEFRRFVGGARDPRGLDSVEAVLERYEHGVEASQLDGMRHAIEWLCAHRPPSASTAICHGDFHPLNVLIDRDEVTGVVDWGWCAIAEPAYDVGATVALMTHGPVGLPRFADPLVRILRRSLVRRYLRAYGQCRPLDVERVRYYEAIRLTGFLLEVGEQMRREGPVYGGSAFYAPAVREGIRKRLRAITDVDTQLPSD